MPLQGAGEAPLFKGQFALHSYDFSRNKLNQYNLTKQMTKLICARHIMLTTQQW